MMFRWLNCDGNNSKSYSQLSLLALRPLDLLRLLEGLPRDILGHVNRFAVQQIFNRQNLDARIIFLPLADTFAKTKLV